MDSESSSSNKKEIFNLWMEGDHVLVHLDSTPENVIVPSHLKDNPALTLKMSHLFQGRTEANKDGITSYLKFSGNYFECIVPWDSIFAITSESGEQKLWPHSLPQALANLNNVTTDTKKTDKNNHKEENKSERKRPTLQRIK